MILYKEKKDCSGCGACANICPKNAISMDEDEYGFVYPSVDQTKCIQCGACIKVCDLKRNEKAENLLSKCFWVVRKDNEKLLKSTSGGVFSTIAEKILNDGGSVFGCTAERQEKGFRIYHRMVDNITDMDLLRGSKYVQSDAQVCYGEIKKLLQQGKKVLFCGTPCQVAGLKNFLLKEYENLFTIDLICHGTPNQKFFNSFISFLEEKEHINITQFNFRKKYKNRDTNTFFYLDLNLKSGKHKKIFCKLASYYGLFLKGDIYRDSCYQCKYACPNRVGDITLGDGWGIDKLHPEYLDTQGGKIQSIYGCNSMMVNTVKGQTLLELMKNEVILYESCYEEISKHNHQLIAPSECSPLREQILTAYKKDGYRGVDQLYFSKMNRKEYIKYKYYFTLKQAISPKFIKKLKSLKNK